MGNKQILRGHKKTALEFIHLQSLFVAALALSNESGHEGNVLDLLEIGEHYAGQLGQKYDDMADNSGESEQS